MATLPDVTSFYHQALIEAEVEFTPPVEELVQVNEGSDNGVPVVMAVGQDPGKELTKRHRRFKYVHLIHP